MALAQWRPLILASAVTAALAGAVIVQTCTQDDPPATPGATATVRRSSPTATATTPPLPQMPIAEVPNPLLRRVFELGELVDVTNAVGFLSAETGAIETWSAADGLPVAASRDGALLQTTGPGQPAASILVERTTGIAYRLAPGITPLVDSAHGGLVIVGIVTDDRFDTAILDLRNAEFRPLGIGAPAGSNFSAYAAADGRRAVMHAGTTIAVVDMVANTAIAVGTTFDADEFRVELLPGGLGFRVVSGNGEARWFGWDGDEVTDSPPPGAPTQNGRYFAEEASFGAILSTGMGAYAALSYVTVHDRANREDVLRFLGASLVPRTTPWNASGDTLLLTVPSGYLIVNLDGAVVTSLDDPSQWLNPMPSPAISNLYGTSQGTILNITRGSTIEPAYATGVALSSRWSDRPGELIVMITTVGKERAWPEQVLSFEVRTPPFREVPQVAPQGETCLPVLATVGEDARQVGCPPPSTSGEILPAPDPLAAQLGRAPVDVAGVRDDQRVTWLHVSFADGTVGWVEASRLGWAD